MLTLSARYQPTLDPADDFGVPGAPVEQSGVVVGFRLVGPDPTPSPWAIAWFAVQAIATSGRRPRGEPREARMTISDLDGDELHSFLVPCCVEARERQARIVTALRSMSPDDIAATTRDHSWERIGQDAVS
jgi:hypothetical protein